MKTYKKIIASFQKFEKNHANATLFIGIGIGVGVGMYLSAVFIPQTPRSYPVAGHHHMNTGGGYYSVSGGTMPMMSTMSFTNERGYLIAMIAHHQDALAMSHKVLSFSGVSERVQQLAEDIIVAQTAEIDMMKKWLSVSPTQQ